jgi:hypothetical protein
LQNCCWFQFSEAWLLAFWHPRSWVRKVETQHRRDNTSNKSDKSSQRRVSGVKRVFFSNSNKLDKPKEMTG